MLFRSNSLYLIGKWNIVSEYAENTASARIEYRYAAKGFYFVAGAKGEQIVVEVLRDGKPVPSSSKGADVYYKNDRTYVKIGENRLYRIIDDKAAEEHLIEFIISTPGLQAFTFTFG